MDHAYVTGAADWSTTHTEVNGTLKYTGCCRSRLLVREVLPLYLLPTCLSPNSLQRYSVGHICTCYYNIRISNVDRRTCILGICLSKDCRITQKGKLFLYDVLTEVAWHIKKLPNWISMVSCGWTQWECLPPWSGRMVEAYINTTVYATLLRLSACSEEHQI